MHHYEKVRQEGWCGVGVGCGRWNKISLGFGVMCNVVAICNYWDQCLSFV